MHVIVMVTLAAWFCMSATRVQANLWCHCDRQFCTFGNATEVCPEVMPALIRKRLLGAFVEHNQEAMTAQGMLEVLIEKGFDQNLIAEIFQGVTMEDIYKMIRSIKLKPSVVRAYLMRQDKADLGNWLSSGVENMKSVIASRNSKEITDEQLGKLTEIVQVTLASGDVGKVTTEELAAVIRGITKSNIWEIVENATMKHFTAELAVTKQTLLAVTSEFMAELQKTSKQNLKVAPIVSEAKEMEAKKRRSEILYAMDFPSIVVDEVLREITEYTRDAFPLYKVVDEICQYIADDIIYSHGENTRAQSISDYMAEQSAMWRDKRPPLADADMAQASMDLKKVLAREQMADNDIDDVMKGVDKHNIRSLLLDQTWLRLKIEEKFGTVINNVSEMAFIERYMKQLPPRAKSPETDNRYVELLHFRTVYKNRDNGKRNKWVGGSQSLHYSSDQFCMKATLPDGEMLRFCGHFATQLVGFQFREGCHYESILGISSAKFCRCGTHLCNGGSGRGGSPAPWQLLLQCTAPLAVAVLMSLVKGM